MSYICQRSEQFNREDTRLGMECMQPEGGWECKAEWWSTQMAWKEGGTMRTRKLLSAVAAQLSAAGPCSAAPPSPLSHTQNEMTSGLSVSQPEKNWHIHRVHSIRYLPACVLVFYRESVLAVQAKTNLHFQWHQGKQRSFNYKTVLSLGNPPPQTKPRVNLCKYNPGYIHTCQMRKKVKKEKGKVQRMTKTETNEREKGRTTCKKDQR